MGQGWKIAGFSYGTCCSPGHAWWRYEIRDPVVLLMVQKFWCVSFFCANTLLEEEIGNEFWNHQQISTGITGMELSCIRCFLQGIAGFLACNDRQKKKDQILQPLSKCFSLWWQRLAMWQLVVFLIAQ